MNPSQVALYARVSSAQQADAHTVAAWRYLDEYCFYGLTPILMAWQNRWILPNGQLAAVLRHRRTGRPHAGWPPDGETHRAGGGDRPGLGPDLTRSRLS